MHIFDGAPPAFCQEMILAWREGDLNARDRQRKRSVVGVACYG
jgi:hypothetical protein